MPNFDPENFLYTLLDKLDEETRGKIAIVGGQALIFWSNHYKLNLSSEQDGYLTSADLDLYGKKSEVVKCAEAWGVDYKLPGPDEHTPAFRLNVF